MENLYQIFKLWHVISFVFMSIPLFNLIVVNERALMGSSFNFGTDLLYGKYYPARCSSVLYLSTISFFLRNSIARLWTFWAFKHFGQITFCSRKQYYLSC